MNSTQDSGYGAPSPFSRVKLPESARPDFLGPDGVDSSYQDMMNLHHIGAADSPDLPKATRYHALNAKLVWAAPPVSEDPVVAAGEAARLKALMAANPATKNKPCNTKAKGPSPRAALDALHQQGYQYGSIAAELKKLANRRLRDFPTSHDITADILSRVMNTTVPGNHQHSVTMLR